MSTSRKGMLGRIQESIALEQRAEEQRAVDNFDPERLVEDTAVETQLIEAQDRGEEIEALDDDLSRADDEFQSMESLITAMESFSLDRGMDQYSAVLVNLALEGIHNRLGVEYQEEDYIALEGFDGPSSRQSATVIALEEQSNKLKTWITQSYEWIKELIRKAVKAIKDFFNVSKQVSKRATAIAATCKEKDTTIVEVSESQAEKTAKYFRDYESPREALKVLEHFTETLSSGTFYNGAMDYLKHIGNILKIYVEDNKEVLESGEDKKKNFLGLGNLTKISRNTATSLPRDSGPDYGGGLTGLTQTLEVLKEKNHIKLIRDVWDKGDKGTYSVFRTKHYNLSLKRPLPDGYFMVAHTSVDNDEGDTRENIAYLVPTFQMGFVQISPSNDEKVSKDLLSKFQKPSSSDEVIKAMDHIKTIATEHEKASKSVIDFGDKLEKWLTDIKKEVGKVKEENSTSSNESNDGWSSKIKNSYRSGVTKVSSLIRRVFTSARSVTSAMTAPINKALVYIIRTCKVAMDYYTSSIKTPSMISKAGDKIKSKFPFKGKDSDS